MPDFVLIESEGLLFRGPSVTHPTEVWDYPRKRWVPYKHAATKPEGWGVKITEEQAEGLKTDNPHAEHYLHYDTPPWAQPVSDSYYAAVRPNHMASMLGPKDAKRHKP